MNNPVADLISGCGGINCIVFGDICPDLTAAQTARACLAAST